ncbi:MAG: PqqD family protein [Nitrospirales bacterium]
MRQTLSLASRVRMSEGVLSQSLDSGMVMLDLDRGVYYGLDSVGTRTWELMREQPFLPLHKILDSLLDEYDVHEDQCTQDLLNLVRLMQEKGLVEVCSGSNP